MQCLYSPLPFYDSQVCISGFQKRLFSPGHGYAYLFTILHTYRLANRVQTRLPKNLCGSEAVKANTPATRAKGMWNINYLLTYSIMADNLQGSTQAVGVEKLLQSSSSGSLYQ